MRYYQYIDKQEILSLLAQIPDFEFDIDFFEFTTGSAIRNTNFINIVPRFYPKEIEESKKHVSFDVGRFENEECYQSTTFVNSQDLAQMRNMRFYYQMVDTLVDYAKNNQTIYYDCGILLFCSCSNMLLQDGTSSDMMTNIARLNGVQIVMQDSLLKNATILKEREVHILGHYLKKEENDTCVLPIVIFVETKR